MAFKTINFTDKNLQLFQQNVADALPEDTSALLVSVDSSGNKSISRSEIASLFSGGSLITVSLIAGQDNLVPHGLSRLPVVWALMGINANATVWSPVTSQLKNSNSVSMSQDTTYLNLRCSANCQIQVWVN